MAMKQCKECGNEVSSKAKKCPSCGLDQRNWFMRHKIMTFFGVVILLGIIGSLGSGGSDEPTVATSGYVENDAKVTSGEVNEPKRPIANVGDVITTDKFEITVNNIEVRDHVGNNMFGSEASEGGTYVAVQWKYKNITDEPVGSFSTPSIKLVNEKDVKYDADIGASASYATELDLNSKVFSDLNPGITVKDAQVFEISKELLEGGNWAILVDSDKDIYVPVK